MTHHPPSQCPSSKRASPRASLPLALSQRPPSERARPPNVSAHQASHRTWLEGLIEEEDVQETTEAAVEAAAVKEVVNLSLEDE